MNKTISRFFMMQKKCEKESVYSLRGALTTFFYHVLRFSHFLLTLSRNIRMQRDQPISQSCC